MNLHTIKSHVMKRNSPNRWSKKVTDRSESGERHTSRASSPLMQSLEYIPFKRDCALGIVRGRETRMGEAGIREGQKRIAIAPTSSFSFYFSSSSSSRGSLVLCTSRNVLRTLNLTPLAIWVISAVWRGCIFRCVKNFISWRECIL